MLIDRLIENIFLKSIRKIIFKYRIKILLKYSTVVDYGLNLLSHSYIFKSKVNLIGFFHFDLIHYHNIRNNLLEKRLGNYSKIICITEIMYNKVIKKFNLIKDKFCLLYNQVDFDDIILKSSDDDFFRNNLNQSIKSGNYIISIARLEEQYKDFPTLIKAYAKCFYQFNIEIPLVIIGDGDIRNKLEELTKSLKINHMVYFLGFQYNPYNFLKHAKICILSSKSEGFGLVLVEAMVLQVPVIATNCPVGPKEILLNGKCGLLCEVSDVDDMVNAINLLYQNPHKCKELIDNANQYLERFNIYKNIDTLLKII